jgi:hypothetical protein
MIVADYLVVMNVKVAGYLIEVEKLKSSQGKRWLIGLLLFENMSLCLDEIEFALLLDGV